MAAAGFQSSMPHLDDCAEAAAFDAAARGLAAAPRRRVLAALRDRAAPMRERELARHATAPPAGWQSAGPAGVQGSLEALRHVHLPVLSRAGLVEWRAEPGTVSLSDHPLYECDALDRLLRGGEEWDAVFRCLADERRRRMLAVLAEADGSLGLVELAAAVLARDEDRDDADLQEALVALHHVHLPQLDEAGLVEYEPERGTVRTAHNERVAVATTVVC